MDKETIESVIYTLTGLGFRVVEIDMERGRLWIEIPPVRR